MSEGETKIKTKVESVKTVTVTDDDRLTSVVEGWAGFCATCQPNFVTSGWPTKKVAEARIAQHVAEHETGQQVQLIEDFRAEHGLVANPDGSADFVNLKD